MGLVWGQRSGGGSRRRLLLS